VQDFLPGNYFPYLKIKAAVFFQELKAAAFIFRIKYSSAIFSIFYVLS
jgi:hypothetical protein